MSKKKRSLHDDHGHVIGYIDDNKHDHEPKRSGFWRGLVLLALAIAGGYALNTPSGHTLVAQAFDSLSRSAQANTSN